MSTEILGARRADVATTLILWIAGFRLVAPAIAGGGIGGLYPSDGTRLTYFVWGYPLSSLASARLPIWNPFTLFGTPFYANMQWATFYPLNLPFIAFQLDVSYNLFVGFHFGLMGALMYSWRATGSLKASRAAVASLAYMLNGQFVGYAWGGARGWCLRQAVDRRDSSRDGRHRRYRKTKSACASR